MRRPCPGCPKPLGRFTLRGRHFFACAEHGILAPASVLPEFFKSQELAADCLAHLKTQPDMGESQRRCPECEKGFKTFTAQTFAGVNLDVCQRCKVFWFDKGEWEAAKAGDFHVYAAATEPAKKSAAMPNSSQRDWLEVHDGVFNLAFEESDRRKTRPPVLTFMILIFSLLATAMARKTPSLFNGWAYFPEQPFHIMSHVTSLVAHADLWHWLGNAIFLWIAGDDVEDETGHWEFLKLFLLSGVAGHLAYTFLGAQTPTVGMSGAVAGLVAYYGIRFPNHRFNIPKLFGFGFRMHALTLSLSAQAFTVIFLAKNLFGFYLQYSGGGGGINYAAHIGGIAFGAAYALTMSKD